MKLRLLGRVVCYRLWQFHWLSRSWVRNVRTQLRIGVPALLRFVRTFVCVSLLLWFQLHLHVWQWVTTHVLLRRGVASNGWHRLLFCCLTHALMAVSLLSNVHLAVDSRMLVASLLAAFIVNRVWRNGWIWCREQLGIRPPRLIDLRDPYGKLVFRQS